MAVIKSKIADDKELGRLRDEYNKLQEKHADKQDVVKKLSGENVNLKAKIRRKNGVISYRKTEMSVIQPHI